MSFSWKGFACPEDIFFPSSCSQDPVHTSLPIPAGTGLGLLFPGDGVTAAGLLKLMVLRYPSQRCLSSACVTLLKNHQASTPKSRAAG